MSLARIRVCFEVPAEVGRRVSAMGQNATIVRAFGLCLGVIVDGDPEEEPRCWHPVCGVEYGDMDTRGVLSRFRALPNWEPWPERGRWLVVYASTPKRARELAFDQLSEIYDMTIEQVRIVDD